MELPIWVDKASGVPLYVQLTERIRLLVHERRLKSGDPMPTVRSLAVQLAINANTVARVYHELQAAGILRLERGVGTFVADTRTPPPSRSDLDLIEQQAADLIKLAKQAGLSVSDVSQLIQTRWQENRHVSS